MSEWWCCWENGRVKEWGVGIIQAPAGDRWLIQRGWDGGEEVKITTELLPSQAKGSKARGWLQGIGTSSHQSGLLTGAQNQPTANLQPSTEAARELILCLLSPPPSHLLQSLSWAGPTWEPRGLRTGAPPSCSASLGTEQGGEGWGVCGGENGRHLTLWSELVKEWWRKAAVSLGSSSPPQKPPCPACSKHHPGPRLGGQTLLSFPHYPIRLGLSLAPSAEQRALTQAAISMGLINWINGRAAHTGSGSDNFNERWTPIPKVIGIWMRQIELKLRRLLHSLARPPSEVAG